MVYPQIEHLNHGISLNLYLQSASNSFLTKVYPHNKQINQVMSSKQASQPNYIYIIKYPQASKLMHKS